MISSKSRIIRLLLVTFISATGMLTTYGQTINMDVLMGDKKIGDITAEKKAKGKTVNANLTSKVAVAMLFKVHVEGSIVSEYKDGKLVKTAATRTSNVTSENMKSNVAWDGSKYNITKDSGTTTWNQPVNFCVLDLYFTEPAGISQAFSEMGAHYLPLTALGNHRYQLQVNSSKKDVFVYNDQGKLVQVETVIAMNKIVLKVRS